MYNVDFKKISKDVHRPTRGSIEAAGWDLYAWSYENHDPIDDWTVIVPPGGQIKVRTGICMSIPSGFFGGIYARSGLATKKGLAPANKVGVIDADYRGEIMVVLYNQSAIPVEIHKNDRIAQLIIQPYTPVSMSEVDTLDDTERGDGGFGSTGTNI